MKLSDLLTDKATIDSWNIDKEVRALDRAISDINNNMEAMEGTELGDWFCTLGDRIRDLTQDMYEMESAISGAKEQAAELMQEKSHEPLVESRDHYDETKRNWPNIETIDKYRDLDLFTDEANRTTFNDLIKKHTSWKYPSVYIRPNSLRFFNALKASDVLYVMEQSSAVPYMFKNLSTAEFNTIHFKLIDEYKDEFISNSLPEGQIGLIVMDNFMNYKPIDVMKQYLEETFTVLREGGYLIFTYNDCDYASGAINFENGLNSFTPGTLVRELCALTGFEIERAEYNDRVSWLCIKKPGELSTLKGGKTLGCILKESNQKT